MMKEIVPHIYRTEIPLPGSPLKSVNSYVVKGGDRFLIIDPGCNSKECLNEIFASLKRLGVALNKTDFFITHMHANHLGLVGTLARESSKVYFNEQEARLINGQYDNQKKSWQEIMNVYVANGFDAEVARTCLRNHPAVKYGLKGDVDFTLMKEGDRIVIGDFHFTCVATPGHSPGHLCLYEANKRILVAGDHVLLDLTPPIAYRSEMEDALGEYLASLEKVNALDVELVLTGHRRPIHDLHGRVKELEEHHRTRLNEVMTALGHGDQTIVQIAPRITWDKTAKTWEKFPPTQKWIAFGETLAHVRYLETRGIVRRRTQDGTTKYRLT